MDKAVAREVADTGLLALREDAVVLLLGAGVAAALYLGGGDPFVSVVVLLSTCGLAVEKTLLGPSLRFARFTIPSFFLLFYLVLMAFPAIAMFYRDEEPSRYTYLVAVWSVPVLYPIGIVLANLTEPTPNRAILGFQFSGLQKHPADQRFRPWYLASLAVGLVVAVLYCVMAPTVQLFTVLANPASITDAVVFRFAENDLPAWLHLAFEIVRRVILPIATLYAYTMAHVYAGRWRAEFAAVLSISLVVSAFTLDRAPVIGLLAMVMIAAIVVRGGSLRQVFSLRLILVLVGTMTAAALVSIGQYGSVFEWQTLAYNVWYVFSYRVAQDAAYMASLAFDAFGGSHGFLHGQYIRLFSIFSDQAYVASAADSGSDSLLTLGPVSFVGDLWRNWGWAGVVSGTVAFGFLHQLIQLRVFRVRTALTVSILVLLLLGSVLIIHGNAFGIVTSSVMIAGAAVGMIARPRSHNRL